MLRAGLLLALGCVQRASAASWDGTYYDPDELKITITRAGSNIVAHSADWEITGTLTGETHARLAGLDGLLSSSGVAWSNGVTWSRKVVATPLPPPTWPGVYHAAKANIDVRVTKVSDTKVYAEGSREGKKWKADGRISGETIEMFSITGRLRAGFTASDAVIDWSNGEQWVRKPPAPAAVASPPPPPLLAAGVAGARPDYWAAEFASAAARTGGELPGAVPSAQPAPGVPLSTRTPAALLAASSRPVEAPVARPTLPAPQPADAVEPPRYGEYETDGDANSDVADDFDPFAAAAFEDEQAAPAAFGDAASRGARARHGGGHTGVLMLLLLLCAGAALFVAASHRRHGALDAQLLMDDARALTLTLRARLSGKGATRGMQRIQQDDEMELRNGASKVLVTNLLSDVGAALSGIFIGLSGRVPEVTSASEDLQPAAEAVGARYDDEAFDAEQGVAASPDKPLQYEWEGEKLSWEAGSGLPPEKLPDYVDYKGPGEDGEVC